MYFPDIVSRAYGGKINYGQAKHGHEAQNKLHTLIWYQVIWSYGSNIQLKSIWRLEEANRDENI